MGCLRTCRITPLRASDEVGQESVATFWELTLSGLPCSGRHSPHARYANHWLLEIRVLLDALCRVQHSLYVRAAPCKRRTGRESGPIQVESMQPACVESSSRSACMASWKSKQMQCTHLGRALVLWLCDVPAVPVQPALAARRPSGSGGGRKLSTSEGAVD